MLGQISLDTILQILHYVGCVSGNFLHKHEINSAAADATLINPPREIWLYILSFLPLKDLLSLARENKLTDELTKQRSKVLDRDSQ